MDDYDRHIYALLECDEQDRFARLHQFAELLEQAGEAWEKRKDEQPHKAIANENLRRTIEHSD